MAVNPFLNALSVCMWASFRGSEHPGRPDRTRPGATSFGLRQHLPDATFTGFQSPEKRCWEETWPPQPLPSWQLRAISGQKPRFCEDGR
jgi:hypothetical protein